MSIGVQEQLKFENAFQQLLINLATRFINHPVDQMDEAITDALQQIVEFLGSIRSSINQLSDDRTYYTPLYLWPPFDNDRLSTDSVPIPNLGRYTAFLDT